jgi:LysM repeat protein
VAVEPPPAPVMPPKPPSTEQAPILTPKPVFHPPVPVEAAPAMAVPGSGKTYTVQNGDSLSKIAKKCGVSARELSEVNGIKDANKIRVGMKLVLPDYAKAGSSPAPAAAPAKHKTASKAKESSSKTVTAPEGGSVYVVQGGDSLSKIASKHGVKSAAIREANKLKSDKIMVGQKLVIPGKSAPAEAAAAAPAPAPEAPKAEAIQAPPPAPAPAPVAPAPALSEPAPMPPPAPTPSAKMPAQDQPMDYTVQPNDSLDEIAKMFIIKKEDIMALNNITDPSSIKPGQKLKIPATAL